MGPAERQPAGSDLGHLSPGCGKEVRAFMRIAGIFPVLLGLIGGTLGSQLPEFTQQYRQRLGGALGELDRVLAEFDRDATGSGLSRDQALNEYSATGSEFLNARGKSVTATLARRDALKKQSIAIEAAPPLMRPFEVLRAPDPAIVDGAWKQYEPAVPVTAAGLVWGALSAFVAWLFGAIVILPFRRRRHVRV
jgi:hypothetical protein